MKTVAKENLNQIKVLLSDLGEVDYTHKPDVLFGASIGQHIRHILEFYLMLVSGSFNGTISYDKRKRDIRIESDVLFADQTIDRLLSGIDSLKLDKALDLEADYTTSGHASNTIKTSMGRELAYCIEHSIHHQALIKAALISLGLSELSSENFGVAYSTIRYRETSCAQ